MFARREVKASDRSSSCHSRVGEQAAKPFLCRSARAGGPYYQREEVTARTQPAASLPRSVRVYRPSGPVLVCLFTAEAACASSSLLFLFKSFLLPRTNFVSWIRLTRCVVRNCRSNCRNLVSGCNGGDSYLPSESWSAGHLTHRRSS